MSDKSHPSKDVLDDLAKLSNDPAIHAQITEGIEAVVAEVEWEKKAKKSKDEKKEKQQKEGRKNDLLKLIHEYQRRCIEFADRKATFLVFGSNAFASFLDRSKGLRDVRDIGMSDWTIKMMLGEFAIIMLALAGFTALWVIIPRISRRVPKGAIYWEAIRKYPTVDDWVGAMTDFTEEDTQRIVLKGIYDLAGINLRKYRTLQYATWLGGVGMAAALLHIAL